jgi:hypothetical protein
MNDLAILGGKPVRSRPFSPWPRPSEGDQRRLLEVLESCNWGGYPFPNKLVDEFAQKFAGYHGAQYGCCVVNGTIALIIALKAAGIRFGDEVIVPAYTWDGIAIAVLDAEGIPCDGRFYEPVYCSDLFCVTPADFPQLGWNRRQPLDYTSFQCPVAERAAYRESVWLPHFLLLGDERDVEDIAGGVAKVMSNLEALSKADSAVVGVKSMSRADRPRVETERNY